MIERSLALCATLVLIFRLLPSLQAQVVIDSFNAGPFQIVGSSSSSVAQSQTADETDIAGGARAIHLNPEDNQFLPHSSISLEPGDEFLKYDRQQNVAFQLKYGVYTSASMNLNLTGAGADRFRIVVSRAPGPFTLTFQIRDNSFFVNERVQSFVGNGPGTYDFSFSAFNNVEFDKLGGILMTMWPGTPPENGPGVYQFDSFTAVPQVREFSLIAAAALFIFAAVQKMNARKD